MATLGQFQVCCSNLGGARFRLDHKNVLIANECALFLFGCSAFCVLTLGAPEDAKSISMSTGREFRGKSVGANKRGGGGQGRRRGRVTSRERNVNIKTAELVPLFGATLANGHTWTEAWLLLAAHTSDILLLIKKTNDDFFLWPGPRQLISSISTSVQKRVRGVGGLLSV